MEVVHLTENNNEDLIAELAAIVSSCTARVYGQQRAQRTTEQIAAALRAEEAETAMQLVEQHVIRATDPRYAAVDRAAFASKNLYTAANYLVRQSYIHNGAYLNFAAIYHCLKDHEA
jgi:hypothetical protein